MGMRATSTNTDLYIITICRPFAPNLCNVEVAASSNLCSINVITTVLLSLSGEGRVNRTNLLYLLRIILNSNTKLSISERWIKQVENREIFPAQTRTQPHFNWLGTFNGRLLGMRQEQNITTWDKNVLRAPSFETHWHTVPRQDRQISTKRSYLKKECSSPSQPSF